MISSTINRMGLLLIVLFSLFSLLEDRARAGEVEEYIVKVAFIFNFTKFIQWPEASAVNGSAAYRVCVMGGAAVRKQFDSIEGKKNGNHFVQVKSVSSAKECQTCDIVFISRDTDRALADEVISSVKGKPILTIGETKDFAKSGGVINFFYTPLSGSG